MAAGESQTSPGTANEKGRRALAAHQPFFGPVARRHSGSQTPFGGVRSFAPQDPPQYRRVGGPESSLGRKLEGDARPDRLPGIQSASSRDRG